MSSYMNYSELQPFDLSNTGIHPTHGLNTIQIKEINPQVQPLIEIKESILDIINKNEDIPMEDKDLENTEVETLINKIQELTPSFQKLQDELSEIDKQYKEEVKVIKKKISSIDSMIAFINQISYSNIDTNDLQELNNFMNGKIKSKKPPSDLIEISNNSFENFDPINKIANNLIGK